MDWSGAVRSWFACSFFLLNHGAMWSEQQGTNNKLLLIVLDGYKHDYQRSSYPGFHHLSKNGVEVADLKPVYPTLTMPNLQSIMTGLYPESHGIVGDYMYDVETNTSFTKMLNATVNSEPMWWNSGDPLWISATKQGKRTHLYNWPGCDVYIHGIRPTCKPLRSWYIENDDFQHAAMEAVKRFANDSADFIGIYHSQPDSDSHRLGTESRSLSNSLTSIDSVLANVQKHLENMTYKGSTDVRLNQVTDLIVMSTQGMAKISQFRVVNLTTSLNMANVQHILADHTMLQIWPKSGREEEVIKGLNLSLDHTRVYRKADIPDGLHYKKGQYVAPIIVQADLGYTLLSPSNPAFPTYASGQTMRPWAANHGYDPQVMDMRGIFIAMGPHFKKNHSYGSVENVCLYQVMCAILGVESNAHNCSWGDVEGMLVGLAEPDKYSYPNHVSTTVIVLITMAVLFSVVSVVCGLYCQRDSIKNWFRHRGTEWQPLHDGVV